MATPTTITNLVMAKSSEHGCDCSMIAGGKKLSNREKQSTSIVSLTNLM